jgi:protease I
MAAKKILLLTGDFAEDYETMVPFQALLAAADVIRGKRVSAYPACAPEVKLAGGEYADIPVDQAVTDGNLVTAPAWPAHPQWIAQFLKRLGTEISL